MMDVRIKKTDAEIPDETIEYLNERLAYVEKLLGSDAELARCEAEIGRDAGRRRKDDNMWFAELQVQYPGSPLYRATNRSESINGAIDDAKAELARQIRGSRRIHRRLMRKTGALAKRLLRIEE